MNADLTIANDANEVVRLNLHQFTWIQAEEPVSL